MPKRGLSRFYWVGVMLLICSFTLDASAKRPEPTKRARDYSLTYGKEVSIPSRKANLPAYVYGSDTQSKDLYVGSGYMGDAQALQAVASSYRTPPPVRSQRAGNKALRIQYKPKGRAGWAGIFWLTPANNWAKIKGAGYDLTEADRLTFWIRGHRGGERVAEVKVGGVNGPYPDSDSAVLGPLKLSKDWEQYTLPLEGKDMSYIVGGFSLMFRRADNPKGATIFITDVVFRTKDDIDVPYSAVTPVAESVEREDTFEPVARESVIPQLDTPVRRTVYFSSSQKGFSPEIRKILDEIFVVTKKYPTTSVILQGHTDSIGSTQTNLRLSRERAKAVGDYLTEKGLKDNRVTVVGYGEERPIADNATKRGRRKNRRVEIEVSPF